MAKMAFLKATQVMALAIFIAVMLLTSSQVAFAMLHDPEPQIHLGRRALEAGYNTTGRGGYN